MIYWKTKKFPTIGDKAVFIQNTVLSMEAGASDGQKAFLYNDVSVPLKNFPEGVSPRVGDMCVYVRDRNLCIPVFNRDVIRFPENGLLFYASLSTDKSVAETGQFISKHGNVYYSVVNGIPSAYFDGTCYLNSELNGIINSSPRTFSAWLIDRSGNTNSYRDAVVYGPQERLKNFGIVISSTNYFTGSIYGNDLISDVLNDSKWHHILFSYDGENAYLYIDGQKNRESALLLQTSVTELFIGGESAVLKYPWTGNIAAVRVYERALTTDEIQLLAQEFEPIEE